jgi:O-antigen ligase
MTEGRKSIHGKIRFLAILLIMVSLPFSMLLNNIAIILLGVNWIFESTPSEKWRKIRQKPLVYCFILFYILYCFGLLYTENMRQGFFELEKKLTLLLFPLIFASSEPVTRNECRILFKAFVFSCFAATLFCFGYAIYLNYLEGYNLTYLYKAVFFNEHIAGKYDYLNYWYFTNKLFARPINMHPVYFAMYLVFTGCLSTQLWWDTTWQAKKRNLAILLLLVFNFIVIILLSSRTQLFALVLIGTIFVLRESFRQKKIALGFIFLFSLCAIGLFFILSNPVIRERIIESNKPGTHFTENKYGEGGLSLRLYKWKYTLETIRNNSCFGTGTGDAQDQLQLTYQRNNFNIGFVNRFNAHNQYLQSLLDLGVLSLLLFLACIFLPAYFAYKKKNWLYLVFLSLFFISCFTESMLEVNKGIVFYALFTSLFAFGTSETDYFDRENKTASVQ